MTYKFSLEVLLDHKQKLENEARRQWVEAQTKVDEAVAILNGYYDQVEQTRLQNGKLERSGGTLAPTLLINDDFIAGQKYRIEAQRKVIRELKSVAEELQEALVEAAKEKKTLEKLKERRTEEYKKAQRKRELKETDEIVTLRHKREGGT